VSFLLEGFSYKVFDEATCTIQNAVDMYSFLQEPFFPTGFSGGVFDEAYAFVVIAQGSVVKQPDFVWIERRTRSPSPYPVTCGLLPKL
jgi:hypothetical protein